MIVLAAILLVLGFTLAWVTGVVAKEEIEIKHGVIIVLITGIVARIVGYALRDADVIISLLAYAAVWIVLLAGLLRLVTHVPFKQGLLVATIYAVITTAITFGLASCIMSAGN